MPDTNLIRGFLGSGEEKNGRNLPGMFRAPNPVLDFEPEQPSLPLSHYLWILRRHRWKIMGFVLMTALGTLIVSKRVTPIYESTATMDVDRQTPSGVIGQDAERAAPNDADQFLATQIKLIRSDSVLRPVADRYHLREHEEDLAGAGQDDDGLSQDTPVLLKHLRVARPANTYLLLISYRSPDRRLAADVANAVATSYRDHTYTLRFQSSANLAEFMEKQLEELRAKMEKSGAAVAQFEKELNVINPEEKTSILSARLLQLNTEFTNAQTERVRKETAYRSVSGGAMEALQVSSQGETIKRLTDRLDEAQQRFADVAAHYGPNHPEHKKAATQVTEIQDQIQSARENIVQRVGVEYRDAMSREAMLNKAVAEAKAEFDRINSRSFQYQTLKREAEADKKLYEELITKIREAGINAGFQSSAIRIADPARPGARPVFPNLKLNLLLALFCSTLLAVGAAIVSSVLDKAVRDPEQVARMLNTDVIGTLPKLKELRCGTVAVGEDRGDCALVLTRTPGRREVTGYEEAIRTLRNSILLADFDRRLRTLMVTSAVPAEGKSTIATHLAIAHAQQGRSALLIDGDLRRPSVHRRLGVPNAVGLSNVLTGEVGWREARIRVEAVPRLEVLPAGSPSRRAGDLIGSELARLLEQASKEYDLVILDSPPLLGFPEPMAMATAVDGVLMVVRTGQTNRNALGSALATLSRLRANVVGIVMNEVRADSSEGYYYHYYGPNYYRRYGAPEGAAS